MILKISGEGNCPVAQPWLQAFRQHIYSRNEIGNIFTAFQWFGSCFCINCILRQKRISQQHWISIVACLPVDLRVCVTGYGADCVCKKNAHIHSGIGDPNLGVSHPERRTSKSFDSSFSHRQILLCPHPSAELQCEAPALRSCRIFAKTPWAKRFNFNQYLLVKFVLRWLFDYAAYHLSDRPSIPFKKHYTHCISNRSTKSC